MDMNGLITTVNGQRFFIDNKDDVIESYLYYGRYCKEEMIKHILKNYNSGTFIDVGSCIGTHSIPFSLVADTVYSFEPVKSLCFKQMANITLNNIKNVTVVNCALGDVNLEHYIEPSNINIGTNPISKKGDNILVIKLDDFVIDNVKLIKIDVSGFELKVLKGAKRTILRNKPDIFIECSDNSKFLKVTRFLQRIGYKYSGLRFNSTPTYLFKEEQ